MTQSESPKTGDVEVVCATCGAHVNGDYFDDRPNGARVAIQPHPDALKKGLEQCTGLAGHVRRR